MKGNRLVPIIFFGMVMLLLGSCVLIFSQSAVFSWLENRQADPSPPESTPSLAVGPGQAVDALPEVQSTGDALSQPFQKSTVAAPTVAALAVDPAGEMQRLLDTTPVHPNDPFDLGARLEGKFDIPPTVEAPLFPYPVGTQKRFWLLDTENDAKFQSLAILQYASDHLYFWVEAGVSFDEQALQQLAATFEQTIYATTRSYFGNEWSPGVDGDPRLHILYARNLGDNVGGYFTPYDEHPPLLSEYSNAHEMFVFNADRVALDTEYAQGVLAHEFQHMIHWNQDRNEDTWVNEGMSELAMLVNGYNVGGSDYSYVADPDIQLNHWPVEREKRSAHYGAAFLFHAYLLDRLGAEAVRKLAASTENGLKAVDQLLAELGAVSPVTGEPMTADDLFADWVVMTYLNDDGAVDGRFVYHNYPAAPAPGETESVHFCPSGVANREVSQYGADYIRILCRGEHTLRLAGTPTVPLLPADPASGKYAFWSNRGDESNMTLTRAFDFRSTAGPLTLQYKAWFDLEEDYDYLYLEASLDGKNWQILPTQSGTPDDPTGNSYGWGYTGQSSNGQAGWLQESVDLSQFAGKQVLLRFDYVTDTAVNSSGFMLDDVSIPQVGYAADFEVDDGGWQVDGFVRVQNVLPQTYRVSVIKLGERTAVEQYFLTGGEQLTIPFAIGSDTSEVILVISGMARHTRQKAQYTYSLDR